MEDWQQRVVDEKKDLDDKITKLEAFINDAEKFQAVSPEQRPHMSVQLYHMKGYSNSLQERIVRFLG